MAAKYGNGLFQIDKAFHGFLIISFVQVHIVSTTVTEIDIQPTIHIYTKAKLFFVTSCTNGYDLLYSMERL